MNLSVKLSIIFSAVTFSGCGINPESSSSSSVESISGASQSAQKSMKLDAQLRSIHLDQGTGNISFRLDKNASACLKFRRSTGQTVTLNSTPPKEASYACVGHLFSGHPSKDSAGKSVHVTIPVDKLSSEIKVGESYQVCTNTNQCTNLVKVRNKPLDARLLSIHKDETRKNLTFTLDKNASACLQFRSSAGQFVTLKTTPPEGTPYGCVGNLFSGYPSSESGEGKVKVTIPLSNLTHDIPIGEIFQVCTSAQNCTNHVRVSRPTR